MNIEIVRAKDDAGTVRCCDAVMLWCLLQQGVSRGVESRRVLFVGRGRVW